MRAKLIISCIVGIFNIETSRAAQMVMDTYSLKKQRCTVEIINGDQTITYENVGTQIATFKGMHSELPVHERFKIQGSDKQRNILFADKGLYESAMNTYSRCLSADMARGILLSNLEADAYLFKTANQSWIDVCLKNFDGFTGVCREAKPHDGGIAISGEEKNCAGDPSVEFILIERQAQPDGHLHFESPNKTSLGVITGAGGLEKGLESAKVKVNCEVKTSY